MMGETIELIKYLLTYANIIILFFIGDHFRIRREKYFKLGYYHRIEVCSKIKPHIYDLYR